jgi:hypothetical protein
MGETCCLCFIRLGQRCPLIFVGCQGDRRPTQMREDVLQGKLLTEEQA